MTLDQLPWVIGLFLVAVVIAALNDMTKPKEARKKPEKQAGGSVLGLLVGVVVTAGVIAYGYDVPSLRWLVPLVFVGVVLFVPAFLLRKVIWLYLKSALAGRLPHVIRRSADGTLETKCPRCSARVSVTEGQTGETAFECPDCGEKGTWHSQLKS